MSVTTLMSDATLPGVASGTSPTRRGRPRATPAEFDEFFANEWGESDKSRKTCIKRFHATRAAAVLDDAGGQDFSFLTGSERPRWEILAELGRLEDEGRIREAAAEICRQRMPSKTAVVWLRRLCIGKVQQGNPYLLAAEIRRTIDDYLWRHPMPLVRVLTALESVLDDTEASLRDQAGPDVAGPVGNGTPSGSDETARCGLLRPA